MLLNKNSERYYQIILFLTIFQSCGIRLFQGIGILLSVILFMMMQRVSKLSISAMAFALLGFLFLTIKNTPFAFTINVCAMLVNATLLIGVYQKRSFIDDLYKVLNVYFVQGMITFVLTIVVPAYMWKSVESGVTIPTLTIGYIFYAPADASLVGYIPRLMGLAWEPGCFQLLLNILIFLKISRGDSIKSIILVACCVVLTGSTAGYLVMSVNALYYFKSNNIKTLSKTMWLLIPLLILVYPFLEANITNKMMEGDSGNINVSGVIRYRDLITGLLCLRDHPLLGIDISDLANNPVYQSMELNAIAYVTSPREWYQYFDYAVGGFTNGFFFVILLWGALGIYLLYGFFTNTIWKNHFGVHWYYLPLVFSLSLISEPITNTTFFYFLGLYNLISNKKSYAHINYCSNL